jgi:hypothetical protein
MLLRGLSADLGGVDTSLESSNAEASPFTNVATARDLVNGDIL